MTYTAKLAAMESYTSRTSAALWSAAAASLLTGVRRSAARIEWRMTLMHQVCPMTLYYIHPLLKYGPFSFLINEVSKVCYG